MENRKKVANLVKKIREINNLSLSEFAEKGGIMESTQNRIAEGKFSLNAELLRPFFEKLHCSVVQEKEIKL